MNAQTLLRISTLVEDDKIFTENPNADVYKDSKGDPITFQNVYTALDETVHPVWNRYGCIYLVNSERSSYFVFTPREFKLQFKRSCKIKVKKS